MNRVWTRHKKCEYCAQPATHYGADKRYFWQLCESCIKDRTFDDIDVWFNSREEAEIELLRREL